MNNVSTAKIYAKRLSVLFPKLDWSSFGVDVATTDNVCNLSTSNASINIQ